MSEREPCACGCGEYPIQPTSAYRHNHKQKIPRADEAGFLQKVTVSGEGCWAWQGYVDSRGYGGEFGGIRASRWAYQHWIGPIPDGLTLDHICHTYSPDCTGGTTCRHRRCVNPDHLEPVTRGENARRALRNRPAKCPQGHAYTPENTYTNSRKCRTCGRERDRLRRLAKRAAA